jgi:hypothetical protein
MHRISFDINDPCETYFLYQRLSIAALHLNSISLINYISLDHTDLATQPQLTMHSECPS